MPYTVLCHKSTDYPGWDQNENGEQQILQIYGDYPAGHQQGHGHRHTQQQVIILPAKYYALHRKSGKQQPTYQRAHAHEYKYQHFHIRRCQRLH